MIRFSRASSQAAFARAFLLASAISSAEAFMIAVLAAPLAAQGHSLWSKPFYFGSDGTVLAASSATDGGAILSGYAQPERPGGDGRDALIAKIAPEGSVRWRAQLGGSEEDTAYAVAQTSDGGCLAGGATRSGDGDFGTAASRADAPWAAKLDGSGNVLWSRILPGAASRAAWVRAPNPRRERRWQSASRRAACPGKVARQARP